jgi:PiT family inorganic phosphate transporter
MASQIAWEVMHTTAASAAAIAGIVIALFFCFTNGFQDAGANTATIVASRSLNHRRAAILASVAGFLGALLGGSAVAFTVFGLIDLHDVGLLPFVALAAVVGATIWNLFTWWMGMPSSSAYALIGGLIGASLASVGSRGVLWGLGDLLGASHRLVGVTKVFIFFVFAIAIGLVGGYISLRISALLLRNAKRKTNESIKKTQWLATSVVAFGAGANNAQKHMGIIALFLASYEGTTAFEIPLWARLACSAMLGLGALIGGWRIMRTLGRMIYEMEPVHGLDSQVVSASSIAISTLAGSPISSTQVIASSIVGAGVANDAKKVRWSVGRDMAISWILTMPASLLIAGATFLILKIGLNL